MGVRDAADVGECLVELDVRGRIAGGAELAFHHLPFEVHDDHVVRRHVVVGNAAGLDDNEAALSVDLADVAPREQHELVLDEVEIRL